MTTNMQQALMIWIDNLLDSNSKKFNKATYLTTLSEKGLSNSESFFKDIKEKLKQFGVELKYNSKDQTYDIDYDDNSEEIFRILYNVKNIISLEILSQRLYNNQEALSKVVQLGYNSVESKGFKFVNKCIDAILSRSYIRLTHKRFEENVVKSHEKLKPYFLKEYQNKWYLIVEPIEGRTHTIFGLDRVISLEILEEHFEQIESIDYSIFDNAIGVDLRDEMDHVVLKVDKEQMNYIKITPLHRSQQILEEDALGMTFSLKVKLNYELKRIIMSFGSHIEVIEPKVLRDYISNEFKEVLKKYS